jgi:prevent-host-death family protein
MERIAMKLSSDFKPVTYLKNHAADLLDDVAARRRTMVITQHGEPRAVIMDVASYEELQESLAMLKLLAMGQEDVRAGRVTSHKESFKKAREKLKAHARGR